MAFHKRLQASRFHPQLEALESRLPLGEALFGLALGAFLSASRSEAASHSLEPRPAARLHAHAGAERLALHSITLSLSEQHDDELPHTATCAFRSVAPAANFSIPDAQPFTRQTEPGRLPALVEALTQPLESAGGAPSPFLVPPAAPALGQLPTVAAANDMGLLTATAALAGPPPVRGPDPDDDGGTSIQVERGESPYVYGIHDMPGNLGTLDGLLNRRGWVLLMKYLQGGAAPYDPVIDQLANAGYGIVVRLHWDTGDGEGTVPAPAQYATFASRAKQTVQNNPSAKYWIVGNETNLCSEWPRGNGFACNGTRPTTQITPQSYAQVYVQTWDRIHELDPTVPNLHVIPAPTGVWAGDIPQWGVTDFLCDFTRMMQLIPHSKIDAFAFHPKTHTHSAGAITALVQSPPDFDCGHNQRVYWEFPVYRDQLFRVPADLRDRKVFFTELNPHEGVGWMNVNNNYLLEAYEEVNRWNHGQVAGWTGQRITGMMVYRWEGGEQQWRLDNKPNVQQDLRNAVARGHRWDFSAPWTGWTRITTAGVTNAAPAIITHNGQLVTLHRGDDQQVYVSRSSNGTTWTTWQLVAPGQLTDTAPAVVSWAGYLVAFVTGTDGYLYNSYSTDGVSWSDWYWALPYLGTSRTVAVVDYFGYLVVLARGEDRRLYLAFSEDAFTWSDWYEAPNYVGMTEYAPGMVVFGERLFLFAVGTTNSWYYDYYDPNTDTWSGWRLAYSGVQADRAVAATVFNARIYLLRKDPGAGTLSYAWSTDGTSWNAWQSTANGGSTNEAPALAAFNGRLYGVRKDAANRGMYVSSSTG